MARPRNAAPESPVTDEPSLRLNPNLEDQDMEIKPVVMGPGPYGSPDPTTAAGRLAPVVDHPLKAKLSDDYGADVESVAAPEGEYEDMTVEQLKDLARSREIEGFSSMKKKELVKEHKDYDEAQAVLEETSEAEESENENQ